MYDYWYRIVLLGDAESAKTKLRENYTENLFVNDNKMTIGVEFASKTIEIDETKVKFDIWDLSSEERFKTFIPSYLLSISGAILIIKINDEMLLSELRQKVLDAKTVLSDVKNGPIPIVVLGIQDYIDVNQPKYQSEYSVNARNIGVDIFRVCRIKDKKVIESVFYQLGRLLLSKTLGEESKKDIRGSILQETRYNEVPEESSIIFFRIVGIGIAIMVIVIAIISIYVGYSRHL
jgi:GTPase SAR1 family protein